MRRKQVLSDRIMNSKNWHKNYKVKLELEEIEEELDEHYKDRRDTEEKYAISKLFKDSSYFYKYSNKFSKTKGQLNGFVNKEGNVIKDPFQMSEMLRNQYESVSSKPRKEFIIHDPEYFFFFTSPDQFSSSIPFPPPLPTSPSPTSSPECEDCEAQRVHTWAEDEGKDDQAEGGLLREEWRGLLQSHI